MASRNPACPPTTRSTREWPNGTPFVSALRSVGVQETGTRTHAALVERTAEKLARRGFVLGKQIGSGSFAEVFDLEGESGYILKLTGDYTEALAWAAILASPELARLPALAHTDCVFECVEGVSFFGIIQEKLAPIEDKANSMLTATSWLGWTAATGEGIERAGGNMRRAGWDTAGKTQAQLRKMAGEFFLYIGEKTSPLNPRNLQAFLDTVYGLAQHGITTPDLHGDNVMYDAESDLIKITDLGLSTVRGGTLPLLRANRGRRE